MYTISELEPFICRETIEPHPDAPGILVHRVDILTPMNEIFGAEEYIPKHEGYEQLFWRNYLLQRIAILLDKRKIRIKL